ncbi:MAG: bifunctional folylpolyglutamate synthase/dihydrofolate synthase [Endomicrobium sp.]|nr:bifunctional folylpolyglutamate synthase/dihydrofolate synthase [Endomicrobium sp.]
MKYTLLRIEKFLKRVGNLQNKVKAIHISGTNGKGSTATFISEILKVRGYKTALYTSPHLVSINERIKINSKKISLKVFDNLFKKYLRMAVKCELSYFEYLTGLAFIYFVEQKVDIAVIEVGLGGRFDATNIINDPLVCVVTSIAKEHQEILGNTIAKIAFEKAEIIKKNVDVVCGKLPRSAIDIIKNKSNNLYLYNKNFKIINNRVNILSQKFDYISDNMKLKDVEIKLLGNHQLINASIAICIADILNKKGYCLTEFDIKRGLKVSVLPARFDVRNVTINNKKFKLILDGAHNIQSLNVFIDTFKQFGFANINKIFIFAVMNDKKYKSMIKKIVPFVKKVILPKISNNRAVSPKLLEKEFLKYISKSKIHIVDSVMDACNIIDDGETVVSIGSFYLAGEILKII